MDELNFDRVAHLLNYTQLSRKVVTIVGLGSGGAPVCDHLTMSGVTRWNLFDPDILDDVNLVKHPRQRIDLGLPKVKSQEKWILDRNPQANVSMFQEDVLQSSNFVNVVHQSDVVLCCVDNNGAREFINDVCVRENIPCITASVFRTGIGGEIFAYKPGKTGCFRCLQMFSTANNVNMPDDMLELTQDESQHIYGLGEKEYRASGLSIDIQQISIIQARMALSILLESHSRVASFKSNWIIFGNRPHLNIFKSHFDVKQMLLHPQQNCLCVVTP